jgi:hypothetical protein
MTELDELKRAMASTPGFEPAPLNLDHVLAAGGRIRRRRRFAVGAASGAAVIAVVIGGGQMMSGAAATRSPAEVGQANPYGVPRSGFSGPPPSYPVPSGVLPSTHGGPGILGAAVETRQRVDGRRWILYVETMDADKLDENLTLVLGRTKTGFIDDYTKDIVSSGPRSGRLSPGFHAVTPGTVKDGRTTPTFGYHAGDATRITARDTTGATVEAHVSQWRGFGERERATIFWFDFAQGRTPTSLTGLTAYDKEGNKLPTGG